MDRQPYKEARHGITSRAEEGVFFLLFRTLVAFTLLDGCVGCRRVAQGSIAS